MALSKKYQPNMNDSKLMTMNLVVCLEMFSDEEVCEIVNPKAPSHRSYHRSTSCHQDTFRLVHRQRRSSSHNMRRSTRSIAPQVAESSIPAESQILRKTVSSAAKPRPLRSSNVMNIEHKTADFASPSPPTTPSNHTRSQKANTGYAGTRRLLPTAAAAAAGGSRILRQTPQRKGISAYHNEDMTSSSSSDESSASSAMCSPRKRNAVTPSRAKPPKSTDENVAPVPEAAPKTLRTPRKSVAPPPKEEPAAQVASAVRRRGRPSMKPQAPTAMDVVPSPALRPTSKQSTTAARRKGRPLLKTGTKAKAVKQAANSSPSSWSSAIDSESNREDDSGCDVLSRALNRLHVSKEEFSRQKVSSKSLNWAPLGREHEASEIYSFVADHLKSGTSGSLFVAGVPGIGKSATIGAVLERLNSLAHDNLKSDLPRFRLVTVNGFHFATPVRFYCEVHRQLLRQSSSSRPANSSSKGAARGASAQQKLKRALGPKAALDALNAYFTGKSSLGGVSPTVLVVDELDALVSASSSNQIAFAGGNQNAAVRRTANFGANRVLYNLLEWASTPVSRLIIVAVANTLDLPERALPLRVVSRLGLHRLAFMPYTHVQLESIVKARLAALPAPVFDSPDAILLAARKVAMASGDARRVLELCRLAVERAMRSSRSVATMQDVVGASDSLSSATSRLSLVRQVAVSWRRVLTALVNVCRMQCRDHGACLIRELHAELMDMWRDEGGFCRPSDVEVIRIVGQLVACGLLAAEDVSQLGIQAHVQLTMPLPDLAAILASLLGANAVPASNSK